jgi:uncharacterized protein with gpF-like domain
MPLLPFRGKPGLRKLVDSVMRKAIARMRREVALIAVAPITARLKAAELQGLLDNWGAEFQRLADDLAYRIVNDTSEAGKAHWIQQAQKALGIPAQIIFETPEMRQALDTATVAAASWIVTIPQQHIGKVAAAVNQAMMGIPMPEGRTLAQQIEEIGYSTTRWARFIARDQLHKVLSDVNEHQAHEIGSTSYIWRNCDDQRVVGNPTGLYPKGNAKHMDHWSREGKRFFYNKPPRDGHAGKAIGCRCYAQPEIDVDAIIGTGD